MTFSDLVNELAYSISDDPGNVGLVTAKLLKCTNVPSLSLSPDDLYTTVSTLASLLAVLFEPIMKQNLTAAIVHTIKSIVLTMMRHLTNLKLPLTQLYELESLIGPFEILVQASLFHKKLSTKPLLSVITYLIQYSEVRTSSDVSNTPANREQPCPQVSPLSACYIRIVNACIQLLRVFSIQDLKQILITVAMGIPYIVDRQHLIEILAFNIMVSLQFTISPSTRLLLDVNGTYLSLIVSQNLYIALKNHYSIEFDNALIENNTNTCVTSELPDTLQRPAFMHEFHPVFMRLCKALNYDLEPLKTKGVNPWHSFQYFLVAFLTSKGIYLDETDLVTDLVQTRNLDGEKLKKTTKVYTQSVRHYFEGELISLPLICTMIRENNPLIMFLNVYTYIMEYVLVFGDRLASVKQLNILFNLISEQLTRLAASVGSAPILVESLLLTFYLSITLLTVTSECAGYCVDSEVVQILSEGAQLDGLKTPLAGGSCARIKSCFHTELTTFLRTLTSLLPDEQKADNTVCASMQNLLSCVLFYVSMESLIYGKIYTYPYSMGILRPYNKCLPLISSAINDKILLFYTMFDTKYSFSKLSSFVRELYAFLSRQLFAQGYFSTRHLKDLIFELNTLFFHRCVIAQFILKTAALSSNRGTISHFNDVPVLSVKAIIDRAILGSRVSKARLVSQLYLLLIYGHSLLDQFILVHFYLKKYYDTLRLQCDNFFAMISDELTRAGMLETDFGKSAIKSNGNTSSTTSKDLIIEDLGISGNPLCMSDVYSTLAFLRAESSIVSATEAITCMPQNWSALIYGSRTLKQFLSLPTGAQIFKTYICSLLQRPDIYSFLYTVLLICEVMCCDVGKLHGYLLFIVDHNVRLALIDSFQSSLELLLGNFTDILISSNIQYSFVPSPKGSSTEFIVGLLNALENVCYPIIQDISPIIRSRIALIQAAIYKTDHDMMAIAPLVQKEIILGIQELISRLNNRQYSDSLLISVTGMQVCPFHSTASNLLLNHFLARAALQHTICSACVANAVSYQIEPDGDHYLRIVSLCDIFSTPILVDTCYSQETQEIDLQAAVFQATTSGNFLSAAIGVGDSVIKLYGGLDLQAAIRALSNMCEIDALQYYNSLLFAIKERIDSVDYGKLSILALLNGNILRSLFFSHAAALITLEIPQAPKNDQTQWAKALLAANNEMQRCATKLLPAFIGAWSGLFDPRYGSCDNCGHLLTATLQGSPVPKYEAIQTYILNFYKTVFNAITFIQTPLHEQGLSDTAFNEILCFSLTRFGLLSISKTKLSELAAIIISLSLIINIFSSCISHFHITQMLELQSFSLQLHDCIETLSLLHALHLTLFHVPIQDICSLLLQLPSILEIRHNLSVVMSQASDYFSNIFSSQPNYKLLTNTIFKGAASSYLSICLAIARLIYNLGTIPVPKQPLSVVINTDSVFYRMPFDHSPLFTQETIVSRIHATKKLSTGPKRRFLVDPLGDLCRTRDRMKELLIDLPGSWDGIWGLASDSSNSKKPLLLLKETDNGIFFFAGHGCGESVLPLNAVVALQQLPLCLFMGCSSLTHIPIGQTYETGTYQYYGSSPLMLGTLWDGISGELDEITACFMRQWTQGQKGIYRCLSDAISTSSLRYLVGYSIVIIGDPGTKYVQSTFT